jgi:hypothetical protein
LGATGCYAANAGYSLYGILKGDTDRGCRKATFINSFFTTSGAETFAEAIKATGYWGYSDDDSVFAGMDGDEGGDDGAGFNAYCVAADGQERKRRLEEVNEDGDMEEEEEDAALSYTLGCQNNRFVIQSFSGYYCFGGDVLGPIDFLETANEVLDDVECVAIYDAEVGYEDEDGDGEADDALSLLYYSQACSVRGFPGSCPDPYGKVKEYARKLESAQTGEISCTERTEKRRTLISAILLIAGLAMWVGSCYIDGKQVQKSREVEDKNRAIETDEPAAPKKTTIPVVSAVGAGIAAKASGVKQSIINFAEKEDEYGQVKESSSSDTEVSKPAPAQVTPDAVVVKRAAPKKNYRRPRLARFSQRFLRGRKKSSGTK